MPQNSAKAANANVIPKLIFSGTFFLMALFKSTLVIYFWILP